MLRIFRSLLRILILLFVLLSIVPYVLPLPGNLRTIESLATPDSRFTTVCGTMIHYHHFTPSNPRGTVVFLHGFAGSLFSFRDNIDPLLQNDFAVVLIDLPGFGLSERNLGADYSNTGRAQLIREFADQLKLQQPVHWVGHSMGGSIIAWLAALESDAAASLTLIAAPYGTPERATWQRVLVQYPPMQRLLMSVLPRFITAERIGSLLRSAYRQSLKPDEIAGYMEPLQIRHTHNTLIGLIRDRDSKELDPSTIDVPVLVIWGEEDTWVSPEDANLWHQSVPDCQIHLIVAAGHNPMETHTDEFNSTLIDFLLTLSTPPQTTP